jgi:hypothetical protein
MNKISQLKTFAAFATLVGFFIAFVEKCSAPSHLLVEGPPPPPGWVGWLAMIFAFVGAVAYVLVDFLSHKGD